MLRKVIATLVLGLFVTACANPNDPTAGGFPGLNKTNVGTVLGGAGGAVLGSNIGKGKGKYAAIAVGTLLGAALGQSIGASLDRVDMMYYNQSSQQALETGRSGSTISWNNPDTGNSGTITPVNVIEQRPGQYCREYRQTIKVGDRVEEGYGTACRQPDGSWKMMG